VSHNFNIRQWITITKSTNGKKSPEERKGRIYKKPQIDLHDSLQRRQRERNYQGELPFSIDFKGGQKEKKHEDRGRNGHMGSMNVSINAKGGGLLENLLLLMSTLEEASKQVQKPL
jgi:hypothetical protein